MEERRKHKLCFQFVGFFVVLLTLLINYSTSGQAERTSRSSLYQTVSNHVLLGKDITIFYTGANILCALKCTSTSTCLSFNYHSPKGMCELNSAAENDEQTDLVYRQGYSFSKKLS